MSLLWRILTHRAGDEELPPINELGPDPEPEIETEAEENAEIDLLEKAAEGRLPALHLEPHDFERAAQTLNTSVAVIRAVAEVEAAGRGFLPDGRPVILYEAHVFGRLTNHRHAAARDQLGRALSARAWDRTLYGPGGGAWQWDGRMLPAADLDWEAAHKSASWGLFQILGTNHAAVGWPSIHDFVGVMMTQGAGAHLDAFVQFVKTNRLDAALRQRQWAIFARGYNGPGFAANQYDTKLAAAYRKWATMT